MLTTASAAAAERVRMLSTQARDPAPHYQHSYVGYNYRLSNLLAAVGRGQLRVLEERVTARRQIFARYLEALGNVPGVYFMPEETFGSPLSRSTRWPTCVEFDPAQFGVTCEIVRLALAAQDIECRPVWKPMHLQSVFAECDVF